LSMAFLGLKELSRWKEIQKITWKERN
jgi:hypothetical protein